MRYEAAAARLLGLIPPRAPGRGPFSAGDGDRGQGRGLGEHQLRGQGRGLGKHAEQRLAEFAALLSARGIGFGGKFVHIAGSKGKSAVARTVSALLTASGAENLLFTSPALHKFTERFALNGAPLAEAAFAAHFEQFLGKFGGELDGARDELDGGAGLSLFECLTALFFAIYEAENVPFGVIETGIGGRLDVTNIVTPLVSVITPIELDHTELLGDTVAKVAAEKAGIIKPNVPVVTADQPPEALAVLRETAAAQGAELIIASEYAAAERVTELPELGGTAAVIRTAERHYELKIDGAGRHQVDNARTAIIAYEILQRQSEITLPSPRAGLALHIKIPNSAKLLQREPYKLVADGAHTASSARALVDTLIRAFGKGQRFVLVVGCVAGHPHGAFLAELARLGAARVFLTQPRHPKAFSAERLAAEFKGAAEIVLTPAAALKAIGALSDINDSVVVVCGSNAVLAGFEREVLGLKSDF